MIFTSDMITAVVLLMSNGASPTQVAAELGISKNTLARHIKENDALREAYEVGLTKFEAKLEEIGKDLMTGRLQGKDSVWKAFIQKYGEGWSDKTEVKNTRTAVSELTEEELAQHIERLSNPKA